MLKYYGAFSRIRYVEYEHFKYVLNLIENQKKKKRYFLLTSR